MTNRDKGIQIVLIVTFLILATAMGFAAPGQLSAKMISINRPNVNMRSGPGTKYKITWLLKRGYPLQVISRKNKWYKVRDFEGDTGWVYGPLTGSSPHLVVKKKKINLRSGPGTNYRIVAQASRGVVFKTIKRAKGWVKIQHENGITAWASRQLLWGW